MLSFVTWLAKPDIISSVVTIRWYGVLFAIGFYIGYVIVSREFRHEGAPEKWLGSLFIYVVVATIIGARLGHVFFYEWDYYGAHPGEILKIWNGGLASHGGTIGIIVAVFIYSWAVPKRSPLWTFDRLVVPVGFVGALIRLGNLMNHEIYGHATDVPWAFSFVTNVHQWMAGAGDVGSLSSHSAIRGRGLYRALLPADVDVLAPRCRVPPGPDIRHLPHHPLLGPIPD